VWLLRLCKWLAFRLSFVIANSILSGTNNASKTPWPYCAEYNNVPNTWGQSYWQSQIIFWLWIDAIRCLSTERNDEAIKMESRVMPYLSSSSPGSSSGSRCLNHSVWVVHKYRSILNCKAQMRKRGYRCTHYKTKSLLILISPVMNSCTEKNNLQLPFKISVFLVLYSAVLFLKCEHKK
jgi:hypothetical protein